MGPDWTGKVLVSVTWSLLLFANYTTVTQIFGKWFRISLPFQWWNRYWLSYIPYTPCGRILFLLYEYLSVVALLCHTRAVFADPGTTKFLVPATCPTNFVSPQTCKPCSHRWKPPRAHHCRKCNMCVFRMDHHCAWIDNCVGIMNQKYFILFLVYTAILCSYQLFLLLVSLVFWVSFSPMTFRLYTTLGSVSVLIESIVFLYMTTDFLSEQLESLETNSTLVESHQHSHGTQKGFWTHIKEVFGSPSLFWAFPTCPTLYLDFTEPVFLNRAVADQLRIKQRRHQRYEEHCRQQKLLGDTSQFSKTLRQRRGASGKADAPLPRIEGGSAAESCLNPPRHGVTNSIASYPRFPPNREFRSDDSPAVGFRASPAALPFKKRKALDTSHSTLLHNGTRQARSCRSPLSPTLDADDGASMSPGTTGRNRGEDEQDFRNVYIKPQTDIGVELDEDDARFIELDDLDDDDYWSSEALTDDDDDEDLLQEETDNSREGDEMDNKGETLQEYSSKASPATQRAVPNASQAGFLSTGFDRSGYCYQTNTEPFSSGHNNQQGYPLLTPPRRSSL